MAAKQAERAGAADTGSFRDDVHLPLPFRSQWQRRPFPCDADHGVMPTKEKGYANLAVLAERASLCKTKRCEKSNIGNELAIFVRAKYLEIDVFRKAFNQAPALT